MLGKITERELINSRNLFSVGLGQVVFTVCQAMNQAAKDCDMSREQIVDRMNEVATQMNLKITSGNSKALTVTTLDKWLNPKESHEPNFQAFILFCQVTGSFEPINAFGGPLGGVMISTYRAKILELAETDIAVRMLRKKSRDLRKQVTTK